MTVLWRIALFLLLPLSVAQSQFHLHKEEIVNKRYRLTYINENHSRPSAHGGAIAGRELFIALPPEMNPSVTFTPVEILETDHFAVSPLLELPSAWYKINGYLWIQDQYCIHITVYPASIAGGKKIVLKAFNIEFEHDAGFLKSNEVSAMVRTDRKTIIENPLYGKGWKSFPKETATIRTDHWIDYSADYIKMGVAHDGIFRIRYDNLTSYGVPTAILDPTTVKIFYKGREIPIYVSGESDHLFHQEDYIEFVGRRNYGDTRYRSIAPTGTSYYEYLNPYSDTAVYWLTWGGMAGKRFVPQVTTGEIPFDTLRYYDHLLHRESNLYWDFSLQGGDVRKNFPEVLENETWHEGNMGVGTLSIPFNVTDRYPARPARAFVKLQDFASGFNLNAHNLALSVNNGSVRYDSGFINKYQGKVLRADFFSTLLVNGNNSIDIHSFNVAGNPVNTVIRDWYELEYPRYLTTTADSLTFAYSHLPSAQHSAFVVTGLSPGDYALYKYVNDDSTMTKLTNFTISHDTLRFVDSVSNGSQYHLLRGEKVPAPIFYYKKQFTNLRNQQRQADYVAITHPLLMNAAIPYVSFIKSHYGVSTMVVNVNDIYDEYNYGFFAPEPVREFLRSTYLYWQSPKPRNVCLIGRATYDYYGNKSKYFGAPRYISLVPSFGNPVSDSWFVLWDTTGALIPQMNIGRLPVQSTDELQSYLIKHQKYVAKGYDDWNKSFIFFAGGNIADSTEMANAKGVNDFIIEQFVKKPPVGGKYVNFYKTKDPVTNFGPYDHNFVSNAIAQGGVFISYIGHSGTQTWDNGITDISLLANNRDRNPLITDFGCSTAKHAEPDVQSFSELAVHGHNGQAIAYIGNSSLGFTVTAFTYPQLFYKTLLTETTVTLGDVHRLSKMEFAQQNGTGGAFGLFMKTNTLIGDPMVQLPVPVQPNLTISPTMLHADRELSTDQHVSLPVTIRYFNTGSVPDDSLTIAVRDEYRGAIVYDTQIRRHIPLLTDSIVIHLPILRRPGEHTLTVILDSLQTIPELNENDNSVRQTIVVAAAAIRPLALDEVVNQSPGTVDFLNPTVATSHNHFVVEISDHPSFVSRQKFTVPFDTFTTSVVTDEAFVGKRIWIRAKADESSDAGIATSSVIGTKRNLFLGDSVAFQTGQLQNILYSHGRLHLDSSRMSIEVLSGGFNDGNTVVIAKNGQNYIPANYLRGHHLVLFDSATLQYKGYYRFDIFSGADVVARYKAFLDSLDSHTLVVFGISDEGTQNISVGLRNAIKAFGSVFIDSLVFRSSWCMIGRKGAAPGTVPEDFSRPFQGKAQASTVMVIGNNAGTFVSPIVGPVASWKRIVFHYTAPHAAKLSATVIGMRDNGKEDTVVQWNGIDSIFDLSGINAAVYPHIKILTFFTRITGGESPSLSSFEIDYTGLAELGMNYQTVQCFPSGENLPLQPGDSVLQGNAIDIRFRVYNAGETTAKNTSARVQAIWENNSIEPISLLNIDSVEGGSWREYVVRYHTSLGFGKRVLQITVDPDSAVRESFKDNNVFLFPVIIAKNQSSPLSPNLTITQSGIRPAVLPVTDEYDSLQCTVQYSNTGVLINDSVSIRIRHFYRNVLLSERLIRRKCPLSVDTFSLPIPILKRSGEHSLHVDLDAVGLIPELNEEDNVASLHFTVLTTDFRIIQPLPSSISSVDELLVVNPTSTDSVLPRIALLEIDTMREFETKQTLQSTMRQFTTEFPISFLAKRQRYFWRIRQLNSHREWSSGSFYLGDSAAFAIGQMDSLAWISNQFTRTTYIKGEGAQIVNTVYQLQAQSAGYSDGLSGSLNLNGINLLSPILGAGHNITVLDSSNFVVLRQRRFPLATDPAEADSLVQFIASIPGGAIVADVIVDDGANNLTAAARNALKTVGSRMIDSLGFRDSWALIGRKGAAAGTVPEQYKKQGSGPAFVESVTERQESNGRIETPLFNSMDKVTLLRIYANIPSGSRLKTSVVGSTESISDTILTAINTMDIPLSSITASQYQTVQVIFDLTSNISFQSPSVTGWTLSGTQPVELAASSHNIINQSTIMEGERIDFTAKIYNIGTVSADSIPIRLTLSYKGNEAILNEMVLPKLAADDSLTAKVPFNSKGKTGDAALILEIDPLGRIREMTKENNSVTALLTIVGDTLRPMLSVLIDGQHTVNGDFVSQKPEVIISYVDNNPAAMTPSDTTNFKVRLNGAAVSFSNNVIELRHLMQPGRAEVRWMPELREGKNTMEVFAYDVAGHSSDTLTLTVFVASDFRLIDVYNFPNPFKKGTKFTFQLAGPIAPEEVIIKIYTVTGRFIQELRGPAVVGFNSILWDGRDRDGDEIGNGVYFYRLSVRHQDRQVNSTSKLVKMK